MHCQNIYIRLFKTDKFFKTVLIISNTQVQKIYHVEWADKIFFDILYVKANN